MDGKRIDKVLAIKKPDFIEADDLNSDSDKSG
jgi:hypothetical protein